MISVVFEKDFVKLAKKLPKETQNKLSDLLSVLTKNPYFSALHTKPLSGALAGFYSFRITREWRVIFRFNSIEEIQLILVGHRKDIYNKLKKKI